MRLLTFYMSATIAAAQNPPSNIDVRLLNELAWRSLGPAAIGGRISAIEGVPGNPAVVYAATGSGGLFKSINAGTTWQPIFERPNLISIGDIAIDPKNPDNIWVGTGEANLRNSVSFGDGVYFSPDSGKTWQRRGLEATMTISRIQLDPRDPRRVFVAAVGHPFGPNPDRGVFFSPDAGRTWRKVLYKDDRHGASDLEISPSNPDTMFAGLWAFDRKPWRYDSGSTEGGLYRSVDGGKTWTKVTRGLPLLMGRIGVKVAPSNPQVVYVAAETREGTLFRSRDGGESFEVVSTDREIVGRGYYYCDLRVDPKDEDRVYILSNSLLLSQDGGKTFRRIGGSVHGDLQALWIDPLDPRRIWQGSDGGLAQSWDAGQTWRHVSNISLGQFYRVFADDRKPFYNVSGGTQDNGTWTGPSRTREPSGILNDDWRMVSSVVGFSVLADPKNPDGVLTQTPGGTLLRTDLRTRDQQTVGPQVRNYGGATAAEMEFRFAWDAPLVRSPHGDTIYYAGNVIFQSSDMGRSWEAISRDLTTPDAAKMQPSGGPVFIDNSSSETYSAITQVAESPVQRGMIWAGANDGTLQVTKNGGSLWTNLTANLPGVPAASPVSAIELSHAQANIAYVGLDRHMFDDTRPYLFKTVDGGATWRKVTNGLPAAAVVWVVREDPKNSNLLYAGTEAGLFVSFDAGERWAPFGLNNLPNVPVRDIFIQASANDILLATHGRGLWALDDATPVEDLAAASNRPVYLFPIRPALRHTIRATRSGGGDSEFAAPNPPYGAILSYFLREPSTDLQFEIIDSVGKIVRRLKGPGDRAGVHRITWDLRADGAAPNTRGPQVLPGSYTVRLTLGSAASEEKVQVELDPELLVAEADLRMQWDALNRIGVMIRRVNEMLRAADQHGAAIQWQKFRATLARPRGLSASETGPRLSEQLQSLFGLIDGPNAAPTSAMVRLLAELEEACARAELDFNGLNN
jgi:photosystem II stability/assembly factor-like uncharacterized protein